MHFPYSEDVLIDPALFVKQYIFADELWMHQKGCLPVLIILFQSTMPSYKFVLFAFFSAVEWPRWNGSII
tara:strand:- start:5194 stop:5403 length:210 start_codon:yes stop_codon:yes gene_type:complete